MDNWEEQWLALEQKMIIRFGRIPDFQTILFLIGINEVGFSDDKNFSKEQKQDIMHVATCTLLSQEEYYQLSAYDEDGWPHFELKKNLPEQSVGEQELWLKKLMLKYFEKNGF